MDSPVETALIILFVVALFGVIIGVVIWAIYTAVRQNKTTNAEFEGLKTIHGEAAAQGSHNTLTFNSRGLPFSVVLVRGKNRRFTVTMTAGGGAYPSAYTPTDQDAWERTYEVATQPQIRLTREGSLDKLGKLLRINREVQTGDAEFDRQIYITSDAPDELILRTFSGAEARRAVLGLLNAGYHSVTLYGSGAPLSLQSADPPPGAGQRETHDAQLAAMHAIARAMPPVTVANAGTVDIGRPASIAAGAAVLATAALIAAAMFSGWWVPFSDEPRNLGLLIGFGGWVVSLPLLLVLMKGRSNAFICLLIAAGCLLPGLPLASVFGIKALNAWPDFSTVRTIDARVVKLRRVKGNKSTSYYATFDPGDGIGPPQEFTITGSTYGRLRRGRTASIDVRDGFLGWPWLAWINE